MTDFNQASARMNKAVGETTERLEKEAAEFIKYLNDEVVPAVRQHSTKALRTAAEKLTELANYMEKHSTVSK
jgi:prophage antirepressor-like protein